MKKINAVTTDGKQMEVGKSYIFSLDGKDLRGIYTGIGFKGMLRMENVIPQDPTIAFNITPQSVQKLVEME